MASPTRWTWVWVKATSWWWTGRPGMLRFTGLQRVGHDWATELNWTESKLSYRHAELGATKKKKNKESRNAQACSLWSLSSLFSRKKWKNLTPFFFFSPFHSNKFPHHFISSISMEKGKYLSFLSLSGWEQNLSFALFENHQLLPRGRSFLLLQIFLERHESQEIFPGVKRDQVVNLSLLLQCWHGTHRPYLNGVMELVNYIFQMFCIFTIF